MNILNYAIALLLTLMVFSYLIGNNPFYRLAQHLFVGVSIGYATLLLLGNLVFIQIPTFSTQEGLSVWLYGLPLLFGLVLLLRLIRPAVTAGDGAVFRLLVPLSTLVMNVAVSTAAALALGGALKGTLLSQVAAAVRPISLDPFGLIGGLVLLFGTVAALHYFRFTLGPSGRRGPLGAGVANAGRWFILIGLGATLGSLAVSFVAALIDRISFIINPPL